MTYTVIHEDGIISYFAERLETILAELDSVYFVEDVTFTLKESSFKIIISLNSKPFLRLSFTDELRKEHLEFALIRFYLSNRDFSIPLSWDNRIGGAGIYLPVLARIIESVNPGNWRELPPCE